MQINFGRTYIYWWEIIHNFQYFAAHSRSRPRTWELILAFKKTLASISIIDIHKKVSSVCIRLKKYSFHCASYFLAALLSHLVNLSVTRVFLGWLRNRISHFIFFLFRGKWHISHWPLLENDSHATKHQQTNTQVGEIHFFLILRQKHLYIIFWFM